MQARNSCAYHTLRRMTTYDVKTVSCKLLVLWKPDLSYMERIPSSHTICDVNLRLANKPSENFELRANTCKIILKLYNETAIRVIMKLYGLVPSGDGKYSLSYCQLVLHIVDCFPLNINIRFSLSTVPCACTLGNMLMWNPCRTFNYCQENHCLCRPNIWQ